MQAYIPAGRDPHLQTWMLFVDGENFTRRGQEFADNKALNLVEGRHYRKNEFLWFPGVHAQLNIFGGAPRPLQDSSIRSHYYTSHQGDDAGNLKVRKDLRALGFQPTVSKRDSSLGRSKAVDVALAKDFLSNAYHDNYDVAVLISGDGDFVPIVEEVQRLGKVVYVGAFAEGLSPSLGLAADLVMFVEKLFAEKWKKAYPSDGEPQT